MSHSLDTSHWRTCSVASRKVWLVRDRCVEHYSTVGLSQTHRSSAYEKFQTEIMLICAVWLNFPQLFSQLRFAFCACMDLRAHRVVGVPLVGGTHSQATSSTTLRRTSTTSSSRLGVIVRRTVAGAPSSQAPTRDTPCTSSSSSGSIGSPASNGTNPRLARPSAVDCWPQASSMTTIAQALSLEL